MICGVWFLLFLDFFLLLRDTTVFFSVLFGKLKKGWVWWDWESMYVISTQENTKSRFVMSHVITFLLCYCDYCDSRGGGWMRGIKSDSSTTREHLKQAPVHRSRGWKGLSGIPGLAGLAGHCPGLAGLRFTG